MATNSTTLAKKTQSDRARDILIVGVVLIVLGLVFELSGLAVYLEQQSEYNRVSEEARKAGIGTIPGVGAPELFLLYGPLFIAAPIMAAGIVLILSSLRRERGK